MNCSSKSYCLPQASVVVSLCVLGGFARNKHLQLFFKFITNEPKNFLCGSEMMGL